MIHTLETSDTFAIYRLPNEPHHYLVQSKENQAIPFEELGDGPAFVFHPFEETTRYPALAIQVDELFVNPKFSYHQHS